MKCQGCHIHTAEYIFKVPIYRADMILAKELYLCTECAGELGEYIENNFNGEKE